jgi:pSer/pThr/pTyr-binding forkhead associated (FHA) protein
MTALTLTLIRLAFLAVLWLFVIAAVGVVRTDLFGSSSGLSRRQARRQQRQGRPRPAQPAKPPRPPRASRGGRSSPQQLLVTAGALAGTTLGLADQQITIGRANDATLVLNDDYASTRHARLYPQDGQWIVEDLGSTNGTYLDRQKVTQPTPVPVGVPIRIGKTVLELRR